MDSKSMCSKSVDQIERELWEALLHADGVAFHWHAADEALVEEMSTTAENPSATISYPWMIESPAVNGFFEQSSIFTDWEIGEIEHRANQFFAHLDTLWAGATVQSNLRQRFAARIPSHLLSTIAQQAQKVMSESVSLADQLVLCVQELLPTLATDDLYVLARPLAYTMRNGYGQDCVESVLTKVRAIAWEQLSEVEQARLTLAVARCALAELEGSATDQA